MLTFDRNVLADTSTTLAAGVGSVTSTTFSGNTATVQLSGVADRQTITIELDNVVGAVGVNTKVLVSMSACIGDVNQNGAVTVEDINLVKSQSGNAVTSSTFKYDVNVDGFIDAVDTSLDVSVAGGSLYPDFAFTGHYYHARSGLYLAPYRAYNPTIGRWLSRDPIASGAIVETSQNRSSNLPRRLTDPVLADLIAKGSLYSYVSNNPSVKTDHTGLIGTRPLANTQQCPLIEKDCWPKGVKPGTEGCYTAERACEVCCATFFTFGDVEGCFDNCALQAGRCAAGIINR